MTRAFLIHMPFFTSVKVLGLLALIVLALGMFGKGSMAVGLFYAGLVVWSLLISYRLTIIPVLAPFDAPALPAPLLPEVKRPDLFAAAVTIDTRSLVAPVPAARGDVPLNLPTVGYSNFVTAAVTQVTQEDTDELARQLEEQAHAARALLSTDALRYLLSSLSGKEDARRALDAVIARAKDRYPSEDGWVVVSEERMREACSDCAVQTTTTSPVAVVEGVSSNEPVLPTAPTVLPDGVGSLAEMIAAGNVAAAFALIGHRPMFALADAVADFDALYRSRRGSEINVSELLKENTATLGDEKIKDVIAALTSALDGMYTSEAEAVKTAIMKAVKVCGSTVS